MSYSPPPSRGPLPSVPASSGTQHSHTKQPSKRVATLCVFEERQAPVQPLGGHVSASAPVSAVASPRVLRGGAFGTLGG